MKPYSIVSSRRSEGEVLGSTYFWSEEVDMAGLRMEGASNGLTERASTGYRLSLAEKSTFSSGVVQGIGGASRASCARSRSASTDAIATSHTRTRMLSGNVAVMSER